MKRTWVRRVGMLFSVSLALLSSPQRAHAEAEAETASELFAKAEQAFAKDEFEPAARLFEAADSKAPHASVIYNAAVSWDHAGRTARAASDYQLALQREGLDQSQTADAEARLGVLAKELGFLQVTRPVGGLLSVAHLTRVPIPVGIYLEPGSYQLKVQSASGAEVPHQVTVLLNQTMRLDLTSPSVPAQVWQATPAKPEAADPTREILGWVGLGAGALAMGTAVVLGVLALDERDKYASSNHTDAAARKAASDYRFATNVAWGTAAGFGAAGALLLLTSPTFEF